MTISPQSQKSRRAALSSIAGSLTAVPTFIAQSANAVPGQQDSLYIPGVAGGAPFRNLVVNEGNMNENESDSVSDSATPWKSPVCVTNLGNSRILAKELSPLNPSLVPFSKDNELYYDKFLFGAWKATATLKQKVFPYGTNYLPSPSLYDGSPRNREEMPGDSTTYELHYFSPNTNGDQITEKSKIAADRVFNALSMSTAYKQLSQVNEVVWDYKKDPTRLTINFSSLAQDMQPLGQKKAEIYLTSRKSESGMDPKTGQPVFCASERLRSVVLVPGNVIVSDTETITEFQIVDGSNGDHVKAISRIAVYLTPNPNSREGILWQDVNGKAVAFFDYEIDLKRMTEVGADGNKRACVSNPSGAMQCA